MQLCNGIELIQGKGFNAHANYTLFRNRQLKYTKQKGDITIMFYIILKYIFCVKRLTYKSCLRIYKASQQN